jgi:DNA-binding CsgD family transcriptional regulator
LKRSSFYRINALSSLRQKGETVPDKSPALKPDESFDFEGAKQSFLSTFGSAKIGAALFDRKLRIFAINQALAEMNRKPVESHTDKTLGEIVNARCCQASSIIPNVFETGEAAYAEIKARLATRQEEGTWSACFLPIKDAEYRVMLVIALVVETTHQTVLADVLRTLLTNLPQVRDALQASENLALVLPPEERNQPLPPFAQRDIGIKRDNSYSPDEELTESKLGPRQLEVVRLLAAGKTNKEVANLLSIEENTVRTYRTRIMDKLGVSSITGVVRFAIRTKLIDP